VKRPIKAVSFLAALLVFSGIVLLLLVDVNAYKPRIEAAASEALGMDVRIHGQLRISLFPGFGVTLGDVRVTNRGTEIARVGKIRIGLKLLPLLRREIRIREFALLNPSVTIERAKNGTFNFETPVRKPSTESPTTVRAVDRILISKGSLVYLDRGANEKTEVREWDLEVNHLSLGKEPRSGIARSVSFSGETTAREVRTQNLEVSDLRFEMRGESGKFQASPITMTAFGGAGRGSIELDLSGEFPFFKVRCDVSGFRLEKFLEGVSGKRTLEGKADFSATLSAHGKGAAEMKRTLNGEVSLRGENLTLHGIDLDRFLTQYEKSQSVSLADAGAFLVAGPLGTALLKGYRVAGIYQATREEKGILRRLVSDWKVKNGEAEARDVALSTQGNRLALTGKLDFVRERFDDVTVALLDEKGCARATQKIRGPFANPQLEKVSILKTLASPVFRLFEETKRLATGRECEVIYSGSVAHPK
jgi:AsmA protein